MPRRAADRRARRARRGAATRALEEQARTLGVTRLLLETGTAQPEAMRLYTREGYTRIDNFGRTPASPSRSATPATWTARAATCADTPRHLR